MGEIFNGDPKVLALRLAVVALFVLGIFDLEAVQAVAGESSTIAEQIKGVFSAMGLAAFAASSSNKS